eukprot:CAMPEP_0196668240 /NCGR_PEP_ID=MMETSP1086-20130531/65513_1 /TAXON_ID=77921 /ORGANISM="Cyanoptyche  gloeocystis , Strain SAG4.97" /LENGTH=217 /DNA_ID=CAMNT_0042005631 /DNA_START=1266 /DNA_END=1919 /DNA_ORIENTATION=+
MWWAGLRGAIAFALALNIPGDNDTYIISNVLFIVLFTTVVMGGGTLPLLKLVASKGGKVFNTPALPAHAAPCSKAPVGALSWFERIDDKYLQPFFRTRVPEASFSAEAKLKLSLSNASDMKAALLDRVLHVSSSAPAPPHDAMHAQQAVDVEKDSCGAAEGGTQEASHDAAVVSAILKGAPLPFAASSKTNVQMRSMPLYGTPAAPPPLRTHPPSLT